VVILLGSAARADEPTKPTPTATEANPAVPAPGHSIHGEAFDEGPRQKAHIMPGMGKVDFPATVTVPEAQQFIDQGVAQLHSFYYLEAERSFRQAAKLDPSCPIAYWGMAMANVNNAKRAKGFMKEAQKRAEKVKIAPREKLYLDALAAFYKEGGDDKGRRQGWLHGLEAIVQDFPNDLDARAWLAMVTWQNGDKDGIGSRQAVDTVIDSVLQVEPMHPGAHHYRIHLWDGVKPIRAEKAAALYAKAAPGIAHAWHMPGHTYTTLQRYADAAYQQEGSARVDHASMLRERTMPFEIHNYAHNNQWLATSLSHIGRARDAIIVARNLVEQPRDPQKNGKNDGGSSQRSGRERWMEVMLRYELWDDLIEATTSEALDWSDIPQEQKERAYSLGLAYAAKGDAAKLDEQIAALKEMTEDPKKEEKPAGAKKEEKAIEPRKDEKPAEAKKDEKPNESKKEEKPAEAKDDAKVSEPKKEEKPAEPKADEKANPGSSPRGDKKPKRAKAPGAANALAELEGHKKLLEDQTGAAFALFAKASSMRPESLARAYLATKQFEKAESTAKSAVDKNPNQFPPLAAYVEVLHGIGKLKEAREAYRKLEALGRQADPDLPITQRLAAIVASWKADGSWSPPAPEQSTDEATLHRLELSTLGPLGWVPYPAESFTLTDTDGTAWNLRDHAGRNVVVLFFLGGKCAHCMQQLQLFSKEVPALASLNTDVVAIGTDDAAATKALKVNADGVAFAMPLLADPEKRGFKAYRAFDDFEDQPLHGTFLIDARGAVRFHRIAAEPFLDVDFVKSEAARVNRLKP
jgi:peroxiredoxin